MPPRDAATVIVIRQGDAGLEVFCVLRHQRSGFLGGAVVFPGGKLDAADGEGGWSARATAPHPRAAVFAKDAAHALALAVAACRETLEEAGIVPLHGPAADVQALRTALAAGPGGFLAALEQAGQRLALGALVPFARWITPTAESRRFDARFFLLELPHGQEGRHDDHETTMSFWAPPHDVLARFSRGEIFLAPPTTRTLELLCQARDVHAALAMAAEQTLSAICPVFVPGDPPFLALPGDPSHAVRERHTPGPTRFVLRDGRFISEEPGGAPASRDDAARTAGAD